MSDRTYAKKENAKAELQDALQKYIDAADANEMGAMETADELSDLFHDMNQPYKVETTWGLNPAWLDATHQVYFVGNPWPI